jgi:hypothetical protein
MTRTGRLRLWAAWGLPAFAVGLGVLAADLTSRHQSQPVVSAIVFLLIGWSFAAAGRAALTRRPENHSGRLLVWTGTALLLGAFSEAADRSILLRIATRYLGEEGGAQYAETGGDDLLIRLEPGKLRAWDFVDDFAVGG